MHLKTHAYTKVWNFDFGMSSERLGKRRTIFREGRAPKPAVMKQIESLHPEQRGGARANSALALVKPLIVFLGPS